MLTLYIDFKSPAAYLAIAPTVSLADRLSIPIEWRPFRTVERDVPRLGKEETVGESHRRVRAESQRAIAIKYAAHQGLSLTFPEHAGQSDLALGALAELRGDRLGFIGAAFEAYWTAHADLDDPDIVARLIADSAAEHPGTFEATRARLEAEQEAAEAAGIVGAPAYVIKDQVFVGREHLPWIEALASASS